MSSMHVQHGKTNPPLEHWLPALHISCSVVFLTCSHKPACKMCHTRLLYTWIPDNVIDNNVTDCKTWGLRFMSARACRLPPQDCFPPCARLLDPDVWMDCGSFCIAEMQNISRKNSMTYNPLQPTVGVKVCQFAIASTEMWLGQ